MPGLRLPALSDQRGRPGLNRAGRKRVIQAEGGSAVLGATTGGQQRLLRRAQGRRARPAPAGAAGFDGALLWCRIGAEQARKEIEREAHFTLRLVLTKDEAPPGEFNFFEPIGIVRQVFGNGMHLAFKQSQFLGLNQQFIGNSLDGKGQHTD